MEDRAISLNAVLKALKIYENEEFYSVLKRVFTDLLSVIPQRPIGHWIEDEYEMEVRCSACGEENDMCSKYCPNCGCRMFEPQERNEDR